MHAIRTFFPIPVSELGGAITVNVFAALATLALVSVALRVVWVAVHRRWSKSPGESQEYVFFHTQLGQYAACLIIAMMFNTVAGIMGMPWAFYRGIQDGMLCRAQGFVMAMGSFAGGYFTVTIAVHTFGSLVLQMRQSAILCRTVIAVGWALAGLMAAGPFFIQQPEGFVYGPDGLLCDIRSEFPKLQFFFHLFPILLASVLGAILYSLIYLVLRGSLNIKGGVKLTLNPNERWNNSQGVGENYHRFVARLARSMLWYPVAYIALHVPYAVLRLFVISGFDVPFEAMIFAFVCWYLLSVVDVLLLYNTFRVLGPAFDGVSTLSTRKDLESFGSSGALEKIGPLPPQKRLVLEEKIDLYRHQGPSASISTTRSTASLLHGRNLSESSVANRPAYPSRAGTPAADYNFVITTPAPAVSPGRELIRQESFTNSLPIPPRRLRSQQSMDSDGSQVYYEPRQPIPSNITDDQWRLSRQRSNQTFGQPASRVTSWSSDELSEAQWPSRQGQSSRMDSRQLTSPSSSDGSRMPPSAYPRSPPSSASPTSPPRAGMRPLLLSSRGSSADIDSIYSIREPSNRF